jgi:putative transposase
VLKDADIATSMDGGGAWRDNVVVDRLWRTIKYEEVYLRAYRGVSEARALISCILASATDRGCIRRLAGERPTKHTLNLATPIPAAA